MDTENKPRPGAGQEVEGAGDGSGGPRRTGVTFEESLRRAGQEGLVRDEKGPERIAGVAVKRKGRLRMLAPPARHHHVMRLFDADMAEGESFGRNSQGFVTNRGRYVGREEGWLIAEAAGQLTTEYYERNTGAAKHPSPGTLFSEDLW